MNNYIILFLILILIFYSSNNKNVEEFTQCKIKDINKEYFNLLVLPIFKNQIPGFNNFPDKIKQKIIKPAFLSFKKQMNQNKKFKKMISLLDNKSSKNKKKFIRLFNKLSKNLVSHYNN